MKCICCRHRSFNALLKTVEEPPPRVVFIMATTEQHKVPETIARAASSLNFAPSRPRKSPSDCSLIADAEKISISPDEALREIARAGDGSMRDAQSAFDQVISFAGEKIKTEDVEKALGIAGADVLARVINGIAEHQPAEALAIVDDLVMRGHNLRNFCRDVLGHLRDLLVVKVSADPKLLDSSSAQTTALKEQAALFSESDLVRFFHSLAETEASLKDAANPRYQVEVGLVKLMEMRRLQPLNQLVERIAALEESLRSGKPPPQTQAPSTAGSTQGSTGPPTRSSRTGSASSAGVSASTGTAAKLAIDPTTTPGFNTADVTPVTTAELASDQPAIAHIVDNSDVGRIKTALEQRRKMFLVTALEGARHARVEGNELYLDSRWR